MVSYVQEGKELVLDRDFSPYSVGQVAAQFSTDRLTLHVPSWYESALAQNLWKSELAYLCPGTHLPRFDSRTLRFGGLVFGEKSALKIIFQDGLFFSYARMKVNGDCSVLLNFSGETVLHVFGGLLRNYFDPIHDATHTQSRRPYPTRSIIHLFRSHGRRRSISRQ